VRAIYLVNFNAHVTKDRVEECHAVVTMTCDDCFDEARERWANLGDELNKTYDFGHIPLRTTITNVRLLRRECDAIDKIGEGFELE
jgi:hypothetical protein